MFCRVMVILKLKRNFIWLYFFSLSFITKNWTNFNVDELPQTFPDASEELIYCWHHSHVQFRSLYLVWLSVPFPWVYRHILNWVNWNDKLSFDKPFSFFLKHGQIKACFGYQGKNAPQLSVFTIGNLLFEKAFIKRLKSRACEHTLTYKTKFEKPR